MVAYAMRCVACVGAVTVIIVAVTLGGCDEPPMDLGDDFPDCLCADTPDARAMDASRACDIPPDAGPCHKR